MVFWLHSCRRASHFWNLTDYIEGRESYKMVDPMVKCARRIPSNSIYAILEKFLQNFSFNPHSPILSYVVFLLKIRQRNWAIAQYTYKYRQIIEKHYRYVHSYFRRWCKRALNRGQSRENSNRKFRTNPASVSTLPAESIKFRLFFGFRTSERRDVWRANGGKPARISAPMIDRRFKYLQIHAVAPVNTTELWLGGNEWCPSQVTQSGA